jgi:hypothetical protein
MKASPNELKAKAPEKASVAPADRLGPDAGLDLELLEDSLAKTPWERMLANDDALRFADSLRAAMEKRNAEPQRIDAPPR